MGRRKKKPRYHGFTEPGVRPIWDFILTDAGIHGKERRRFFNRVSFYFGLAVGFTAAVAGYLAFGVLGAIVGFGVGTYWGNWIAVKRRMFR